MKKIYFNIFYSFAFLFFWNLDLNSQTKVIPYQQLVTSSGSSTGSGIYFGASMTPSLLTVTFEGPADRWIALGLGTYMNPTDVLVYSSGQASSPHTLAWKDYYNSSTSTSGVNLDSSQDWTIVSTNTVAGGQRTVTATRVLNTGDANDVVVSYTASALHIVWARGATADYTLANHGSTNRAYNILLPWLSTPTASFSSVSTTVCQGSSITFTNLSTGGLTTYTWSFGGASPATSTSTNPVVNYPTPGTFSVALTASNSIGTGTYSQINYITVSPTVAPSVSINQTNGSNPICSGTPASFSALPVNGGTAPTYQWLLNGNSTGQTGSTFTTAGFSNTSFVSCVLISNAVCRNPNSATSAPISMTVNSSAPASVSVSINGGTNPCCNGSSVSFTAIPGNGGNSPTYQWQVNGINVGTNSTSYTSTSLNNSDVVTCILSSNAVCASLPIGTSSGITMTVSSVLIPSVNITISNGTNPMCAGSSISFTANSSNGGNNPIYAWFVNGLSSGSNSSVFTSSTVPNSAIITCSLVSSSSCANPTSAISSPLTITVNPVPLAPSITPNGTVYICAGGNKTLVSSATSGNNWSNGSNTQSIIVSSAGIYTVTQTLLNCTSFPSPQVTVSVYTIANASLLPEGPICFDSPSILLQGSPSGGSYSGNGVNGNQFDPSQANIGDNLINYLYSETLSDNTLCSDTAAIVISVLDCTGIQETETKPNVVSVFPNPSNEIFTVQTKKEIITSFKVFDVSGKLILNETEIDGHEASVNLSSHPAGVYILELKINNQIVRSRLTKRN